MLYHLGLQYFEAYLALLQARDMGKSLAKKQHSNDGTLKCSWLHSCRKLTGIHEPVKRSLAKGTESHVSVIKKNVAPLVTLVCTEAETSLTAYPTEPMELDHPIRCPQPEPGVIHDGDFFRKKLQSSTKKTREISFLTEKEVCFLQSRQPLSDNWPIFPCASAPEPSISKLLD
ncbi:hypothetical protein GOP47_0008659 [Adiantum capillus-veneris]|uniref:Uncharacterized protein n=1 Tax=Adiantum capillus-veneris TaxID=13818 RepID=A0A9D4UZ06_ADICA|nr:hypothetical protein GOP47_0008659 [Adiantum capillus-veneris]